MFKINHLSKKQSDTFCFILISILAFIIFTGSIAMAEDTEIAPYTIIKSVQEKNIDVREYENLILVETPMNGSSRNGAFGRLFGYISGDNIKQSKIPMTAPVFMDESEQGNEDQGEKIPMTAPVFMDDNEKTEAMMSFVMPSDFTIETTPVPTNEDVTVRELKNYKVAVIRFNGRLTDSNIAKHKDLLMKWLQDNQYKITGPHKYAGYDAPFTLPWNRRNEVLIPVDLK